MTRKTALQVPCCVSLCLLLAVAVSAPVEAQGSCQFSLAAAPASGVPAALWGDLKPVDAGQLPSDRDNTGMSDLISPSETRPRWMSIDIENSYGFVAITHGLQIWDLSSPAAPAFRGVAGPGSFLSWRTDPHEGNPARDVDSPPGNDDVTAVAVVGGGGLNVFDTSVKNSPVARYADGGKTANQVYAGRVGGKDYAFVASTDAGLLAYDLEVAGNLTTACIDNSPSSVTCGVYRGRIGSRGGLLYVDGVSNAAQTQLWVASAGGRTSTGMELWNVSNPTNPQLVFAPTFPESPSYPDFVHGVALWRNGSSYYLALRVEVGNNTTSARIYDVSCIATSSCTGLPAPIWSRNLPNESAEFYITASEGAGRRFLYFGNNNRCASGLQNEWLYDVSSPSSPTDVTPGPGLVGGEQTGYWGWYYRANPTGFNEIDPRIGKFNGQHFYRTAYSIFDIHVLNSGGPPTAAFSHTPALVYEGQQIDFADSSLGNPASWSWTFQDATPPTSTSQNPQNVVFNSPGAKSVSLQVTNGFGTDTEVQSINVLDPAPVVASVTVSPNPAFVCQPITFTATGVTGFPLPTLSWDVQGTSGSVATGGNVNPFVWSTTGATLPGTYTGTVTAASGAGSDAAISPTLVLSALPTLPLAGAFTPITDLFTGGTVQFHVNALGATAWCWNFGDGTSFPTGCLPSNPGSFSTDPVAGPNPSHTYQSVNTYVVSVSIRNCVEGVRTSAPLSVSVTQVTPLIADFAAQGVFCTGSGCFANTNTPITFTNLTTGLPDFYDYDWAGDGTYEDANHTTPVTIHTYSATGTVKPTLRVRRGTEQDVFEHRQIVLSTGSGGGLPSAAISGPLSGQVGAALSYSVSASNCSPAPSTWTWDVGGGTISGSTTGNQISVSFSTSGTKVIRATAGAGGCTGTSDTHSVSITTPTGGGTLAANFSFTPINPTPGQQVSFDGTTSTGSPTGFTWHFGDNTSGTGVNVTHTYAQSGTYQVQLEVSKPGNTCPFGTCSASVTKTVTVGGPTVAASFTSNATCGAFECTAETGQAVSFTSTSQNATVLDWTFGDQTSATGATASHTWNVAGNYQVVLTARDGQGGSAQATKLFRVEEPPTQDEVVILPWIADTTGALEQLSDLYVTNPGTEPMNIEISFRVRGTPEATPPSATRTVGPKATFYAPDVLNDLFDRNDTGGFLVVKALDVAVEPVVVSLNRTFQPGGKTYGQLVPGIGDRELADIGRDSGGTQYLLGLFDTNERLTQIGLTNPHPETATYRLRFVDHLGNIIASTPQALAVAPWGQKQFQVQELRDRFGLVGRDDYRVEVVQVSGQTLFAYAGVIRTGTEDPSFVQVSLPNRAHTYLVGATSTPGFNNALFVTDVVLSNPTTQVMQVEMKFRGLGVDSPELGPVDITLLPNETQRIEDVIFDRFNLHDTVGFLTFDSEGAGGLFPLIHGEVYQDSGPQARYGLFMPSRRDAEIAGVGQQLVLSGLRQLAEDSNTSLLLFNPAEESALCDLVYYGLGGQELGRITNYTVSPGGMRQINPSRHPLPAGGVTGGFSVVVEVKAGSLMGGAQVVINRTNDPAYISAAVR